jgi:hypothetical protein
MTVVTDKKGRVIATYRHPDEKTSRKDQPKLRLRAGPKQVVQEIDLPSALEEISSAEELHTRLAAHLKKGSKKKASKRHV